MITIVEDLTEQSMNTTAEDFKKVLSSKKKLDSLLSGHDILVKDTNTDDEDEDSSYEEEKCEKHILAAGSWIMAILFVLAGMAFAALCYLTGAAMTRGEHGKAAKSFEAEAYLVGYLEYDDVLVYRLTDTAVEQHPELKYFAVTERNALDEEILQQSYIVDFSYDGKDDAYSVQNHVYHADGGYFRTLTQDEIEALMRSDDFTTIIGGYIF